ncbi:MAG: hypothetical protein J5I98_36560 [Phaeodactylibacter sp.]|nr:hypothetical protein [Phaeodactylibacter sp.]
MSKRSNISQAISGLTSLDAFAEMELAALERRFGPAARQAAEAVLEWLAPEGGGAPTLPENKLRQSLAEQGVKASALQQAIAGLLSAGLLSKPSTDSLRLGSNALAAALEQRFLGQRTLRREALALIRDKHRRNDLLSEKELNQVGLQLPYLDLTQPEKDFVRRSEQTVKRRRRALWGAIIIVILMLSLLAWNWFKESKVAEEARVFAESKAAEARDSARVAEQLRQEAEALARSLKVEKDTSEARRLRAELNEKEARLQAILARQAARRAGEQEALALGLAGKLRIQLDTVNKYRALAEADRKAAVDSASSAQRARQRAEALSLILKSRNIALNIPQLTKDSTEKAAALAYQAYALNRDNSQGDVYNSDLYKALYYAHQALREKYGLAGRDTEENVHQEAVTSIVRATDGSYFSAGSDGRLLQVRPGKDTAFLLVAYPEVLQKLIISPDGRWLLACPRLGQLKLFDLQAGSSITVMYESQWGATDALYLSEEGVFLVVGHAGGIHRLAVGRSQPTLELLAHGDRQFRAIGWEGHNYFLLDAQGTMFFTNNTSFPVLDDDLGSHHCALATSQSEKYPAQYFAGWKYGGFIVSLLRDGLGSSVIKDLKSVMVSGEFSPDGRLLATLSRDGVVQIIDLHRFFEEKATYQPIVLDIEDKFITAICFSADSQELLAGTKDGNIHRFYLDPEQYARRICELLHLRGNTVDWEAFWLEGFKEKGPAEKCY